MDSWLKAAREQAAKLGTLAKTHVLADVTILT